MRYCNSSKYSAILNNCENANTCRVSVSKVGCCLCCIPGSTVPQLSLLYSTVPRSSGLRVRLKLLYLS